MKIKKSKKDIAFEKERTEYRHEIRNLQSEIKSHLRENAVLTQRVSELEDIIGKKDECINLLLTYTELTEENMKKQIRTVKSVSDITEHMDMMNAVIRRFGGIFTQ